MSKKLKRNICVCDVRMDTGNCWNVTCISDLLVFRRKDLCEAKHKTASVFEKADVPPSRGICWPRGVLCKVILTFWRIPLTMHWPGRYTPLIEASGGQEEYCVRSSWHSAESVSHIAECRHTYSRCTPLLIELSATEPDFTSSLSHIGKCTHTQGRHITPTTLLIKPSATEP